MKIYLASRYSRYLEMQKYRDILEAAGHTVTSRWINGNHQLSDDGLSDQAKISERIRLATEDMSDLLEADMCLFFSEQPRSTATRGGRHVEFGIFLGMNKTCIVIGPRENIFHCLPQVHLFPDFDAFGTLFLNIALTTRFVCECGFEFSISNDIKDENALKAHRKCVCGKEMREKGPVTK